METTRAATPAVLGRSAAPGGAGRGGGEGLRRRPTPLEDALAGHVAALAGHRLPRRHLDAVLDRLGVRGRPPLTLAEAGRVAGLSGERVRQLEARLRKEQAAAQPPPPPELDEALAAVAEAVPVGASGVPEVLRRAGLTRRPFSAESLVAAARLLGRAVPFAVSGVGPGAALFPPAVAEAAARAPLIEARARRQVERTGATTLAALGAELAEEEVDVPPRHLEVVVRGCTAAVVRGDGWLWFADGSCAGAFVRASRRMLAVNTPLPVESLHEGLRRHNAFRRRPPPPPVEVLAEVYDDHPGFCVADGLVTPTVPVPLDAVGPLNRRILEILRSAPGGVMPRTLLLETCHDAGLNLTSVNLYTTYSECLERVGPGMFAARGTAGAGGAATARRAPRVVGDWPACGWTPDGRPWLAGRVTAGTWANGVLHVPAEVQPA
ncbi:MAG: hypothetical protein ACLGIO_07570, partial [Acidimicrobiia bacterium]